MPQHAQFLALVLSTASFQSQQAKLMEELQKLPQKLASSVLASARLTVDDPEALGYLTLPFTLMRLLIRRLKFIQYRTGVWNCLQTPAPVLNKISGPMGAQLLSSTAG